MGGLPASHQRHGKLPLSLPRVSVSRSSHLAQWLHYLLDKLLHAKRLRKPIAPKKPAKEGTPPTFTELECWECLTEVEGVLRGALDDVRRATAKKGRRKTQAVKPAAEGRLACAVDVVELAYERGWLAE